MSEQNAPQVPYGPPLERHVGPRWAINKKDAAKIAIRVAAPFVIGAILKSLAKK